MPLHNTIFLLSFPQIIFKHWGYLHFHERLDLVWRRAGRTALLDCLARVMGTTVGQNWENWIGSPPPISYQQHPRLVYLYASLESRLARALMTVVMLREKREPGPRRSWYVGLSEEDSCRHNLLLTGWYGYFLSDPPLRLEAAPAAHSVHTAAGKIFLMGLMSVFIVFSHCSSSRSLFAFCFQTILAKRELRHSICRSAGPPLWSRVKYLSKTKFSKHIHGPQIHFVSLQQQVKLFYFYLHIYQTDWHQIMYRQSSRWMNPNWLIDWWSLTFRLAPIWNLNLCLMDCHEIWYIHSHVPQRINFNHFALHIASSLGSLLPRAFRK